jgi:hypothetical protein
MSFSPFMRENGAGMPAHFRSNRCNLVSETAHLL